MLTRADKIESFGGTFPRQAMPEVLKVASEITDSFHVAADANMDVHLVSIWTDFPDLLRYSWTAWVEESVEWRVGARPLMLASNARFPSAKAVPRIRSGHGKPRPSPAPRGAYR